VQGDYDKARDAYRSFGAYLRSQRQLAQLTLRQLAELSSISNPYLSQIERGLHQPSVAVIRSIADALNLSADALLAQVAGLDETEAAAPLTTESAIRADALLTSAQKAALLSVYRSMIGQAEEAEPGQAEAPEVGDEPRETPDTGDGAGGPGAAPAPPGATPRAASRRARSSPAGPAKRAPKPRRQAPGPGSVRPGPDGDPADPSER
jgi:transcriptional regulator with XRE-family HTH domain